MRHLLGLLLILLLPLWASPGDVVAGRRNILFHDAWTPLPGAALTPLGVPARSAAFDGERFLVAWREGEALRLGLFEEGATAPLTVASFAVPAGAPIVRWDGIRYVVVVTSSPAQLAIVSRQGVIETRAEIPETRGIVGFAAGPSGMALVSDANGVDVLLLDSRFRVATRTTVSRITSGRVAIAPFGSAFYVAWEQSSAGRYGELVGTRVLLDGNAPDGSTSIDGPVFAHPSPYAVLLHPYGERLVVTALREYGYNLSTNFVEPSGSVTRPGWRMRFFFLPRTTRTVRLLDGSIVVVRAENGVAKVDLLVSAPGSVLRRRSAGH